MAIEIGVREFKNGASNFIDRVADGEVITVTKRGKPVARVVPAGMHPGIAQLVAEGKAHWNGRTPELPQPIRLRGEGPLASDYVSQGRR
jgi:prevent-host-death family protein